MDAFTKDKTTHSRNVQNAEYSLVMLLVMHNLPFLLMDFLSNLLRECCPDSKIAKDIKCGRTKARQLTKELGRRSLQSIVSDLQKTNFSLIVDDTTDVSNRKALVLVACYFHALKGMLKDTILTLIELEKCASESI